MKSETRNLRGRPVAHDEAEKSAQRLINSHFRNPDGARMRIPANCADDDITILDYIAEQRERDQGERLWNSTR